MYQKIFKILLIGSLILIAGCVRLPTFAPSVPALEGSEAKQICAELVGQSRQPEALRALVNATLTHNDESVSFRYAIASQGLDRIRIDVLPIEGAFTLAILVVNDGKATLLETQNREAFVGSDPATLLERLLGLEGISTKEVRALLTAKLPPLECSTVRVYPVSADRVILVEEKGQAAWTVSRSSGVLSKLQVVDQDAERILLEAELSEVPRSIALHIYSPARALGALAVEKLSEPPTIPDSIFEVSIPRSYSVNE